MIALELLKPTHLVTLCDNVTQHVTGYVHCQLLLCAACALVDLAATSESLGWQD